MASATHAAPGTELLDKVQEALNGQIERSGKLESCIANFRRETQQLKAELKRMGTGKEERSSKLEILGGECKEPTRFPTTMSMHSVHSVPTVPVEASAVPVEAQNFAPVVPGMAPPGLVPDFEGNAEAAGTTTAEPADWAQPKRMTASGHSKLTTHRVTFSSKNVHHKTKGDGFLGGRKLFVDEEEVKRRLVDEQCEDRKKSVCKYTDTGIFQCIARNRFFETASLIMVGLNSVWISVDIDFNDALVLSDAEPLFQVVANLFCIAFVIELFVRFMAYRSTAQAFSEFWFVFDAVLVLTLVVETWVMTLVVSVLGSTPTSGLRWFAVLRMMRLFRVLRMARIIREIPEVMVILRGILLGMRAISVMFLLIVCLIYVSAIMLRVALEGTMFGQSRFSSVAAGMGCLLLDGTLSGSKGVPVIREGYTENPVFGLVLLAFVLLANVTMMGVLSGCLVQTVRTIAAVENEQKAVSSIANWMENLWNITVEHDENSDECVDPEELDIMLSCPETVDVLKRLGVDVNFLTEASGVFFEQHGGRIDKAAFKRLVLSLRGNTPAKVQDHVDTRKYVKMLLGRTAEELTRVQNDIPLT